jgi:hypothetical protein
MYQTLLFFHSLFRWLVLISLLYAIASAYRGYINRRVFTKLDNKVRHWTATIAHVQLMLGATLYFTSPFMKSILANFKASFQQISLAFFSLIHIGLMFIAIILITIGSALAKRHTTDSDKFRTMLIWFSIGLAIIFLAIPWPFSPLANRPYFRSF